MQTADKPGPVSTESGMQSTYADQRTAVEYVERRFANELNGLLHDRQVEAINRLIARQRPERVLELACGPGRLTRDIHEPARLTCLEFNREMICVARQCCGPEIAWIRGNAFELPLRESFDLVYSFRFIRHFHRADRDRLYGQIRSVLRPGGMLVMDGVNRVVSGPMREAQPDEYVIYDKLYRSEDEIRTELAAVGFELVELEPVQRWYSAQYQAQVLLGPRSRWLCRLAIRTLERLRRGPALEWIVSCRRA